MSNKKRERFPVEEYFSGRELSVAEAIYYGDKKLLENLFDQGIPINHVGQGGFTYLMYAVMIENYEVTEFLLKKGADPNQLSPLIKYEDPIEMDDGKIWPLNMLPLETCSGGPSYPIKWSKLLVKHGAKINDNRTKTPMFQVIMLGDMDRIKWLIENGADINFTYRSTTPIMTAAGVMNWDLVDYLLDCGADVFRVDNDGYTLGLYLQEYINRDEWTPYGRKRLEGLIQRLKEKGVHFPVVRQPSTPIDSVSKVESPPAPSGPATVHPPKTPPSKPPHSWILDDDDDNWIIS